MFEQHVKHKGIHETVCEYSSHYRLQHSTSIGSRSPLQSKHYISMTLPELAQSRMIQCSPVGMEYLLVHMANDKLTPLCLLVLQVILNLTDIYTL